MTRKKRRREQAVPWRPWGDHPVIVFVLLIGTLAALLPLVSDALRDRYSLRVKFQFFGTRFAPHPRHFDHRDVLAHALLTNQGRDEVVITEVALRVSDPSTSRRYEDYAVGPLGAKSLDFPITIAPGTTIAKDLSFCPGGGWPVLGTISPKDGERVQLAMVFTLLVPTGEEVFFDFGALEVVAEVYSNPWNTQRYVRVNWPKTELRTFEWKQ